MMHTLRFAAAVFLFLSGLLPSSLGIIQLKILCVVVCAQSECVALPLLGSFGPRCSVCCCTSSSLRGCRAIDIYLLMRTQATVRQPAVGLFARLDRIDGFPHSTVRSVRQCIGPWHHSGTWFCLPKAFFFFFPSRFHLQRVLHLGLAAPVLLR